MSQTLLGTGAFGAVYLGVHEETGQMIAVKQITIGSHNNKETQNQIEQLASEIRLMKQLDHPNIVKYLHAERVENQLLIYMELMSGGSLASLVKKFTKLPESVMKVYMRQVLVGVAYLHQKNVVHRDIKADNILLSSDGTAKISDFGTSREFSDSANLLTVTGTPWFMAPEVVKGSEGSGHGAPADIWSLGCTMIELVQGKPPWWKHSNPVTVMYQIGLSPEKIFDEIPESATEQLKQLLRLCFVEEPSQRITAAQILDHPYFAEDDETSASDVSSNMEGDGPTQAPPVLAPRPPSPAPGAAAAGNVPVPVPLNLARATRSNSPSQPTIGTPKGYALKLRTETQSHQ
jgi:serine/threonine protein kinase